MKQILVYLIIALFAIGFVMAVAPRLLAGNPTCSDAGYNGTQYKIDPPNPGSYIIDGVNEFRWTTSDNITFNWTSSIGIDAVMCKGGNQGAYVYDYTPASTGDNGLYCPDNCNKNGCTGPAGISHIIICFDGFKEIPEFTAIGASLALIGAGLFIYRKRR